MMGRIGEFKKIQSNKKKKLPLLTTIWMNLIDIMIEKISHDMYCVIPFHEVQGQTNPISSNKNDRSFL